VRRARLADIPAIAAMARELNALHGDPARHLTRARVRRDGFGRRRSFDAFVAEFADLPAGFALVVDAYESGWAISGLYVHAIHVIESRRRRGIGSALLAAVAAEAERRGCGYVWTTAAPWNKRAHAFYRATRAEEERVLAYSWAGARFRRLARAGRAQAGR
jgi:GNAT superfamily N-acetyltransferase